MYLSNIISVFSGNVIGVLANILIVPVLIRTFGIEGYGIYAYFLVSYSVVSLLDLGLGLVIIKRVVECYADNKDKVNRLTTGYEGIYLILVIIIILCSVLYSFYSSIDSSKTFQIEVGGSKLVIVLIGLFISAQFLSGFYVNLLRGYEKHKLAAIFRVIHPLLILVAAIILSILGIKNIIIFFVILVLVAFINMLLLRFIAMPVPKLFCIKIDVSELKSTLSLCISTSSLALLMAALLAYDKLLAAYLMEPEDLALYMIGFTIISSVSQIVYPVSSVMYARVSAEVIKINGDEIKYLMYSLRLVSLLVTVGLLVFATASFQLIELWVGLNVATEISGYYNIIIYGSYFYGIQIIFSSYIIAIGNNKLLILLRSIVFIIHGPLCYMLFNTYNWAGFFYSWAITIGLIFIAGLVVIISNPLIPLRKLVSIILPSFLVLIIGVGDLISPFNLFNFMDISSPLNLLSVLSIIFYVIFEFGVRGKFRVS
jgi:O-antigen/teichoic acid export membrane protein